MKFLSSMSWGIGSATGRLVIWAEIVISHQNNFRLRSCSFALLFARYYFRTLHLNGGLGSHALIASAVAESAQATRSCSVLAKCRDQTASDNLFLLVVSRRAWVHPNISSIHQSYRRLPCP